MSTGDPVCAKCGRLLHGSFTLIGGMSVCGLCVAEMPQHSYAQPIAYLPLANSLITARQIYKAAALIGLLGQGANPNRYIENDDVASMANAIGDDMADKDGLP